jgi:hypothetical protein
VGEELTGATRLKFERVLEGLQVRRHLGLGEFRGYGYFPGVEIQQAPPLVYLVAPALRFHPATGTLLTHLAPDIEFVRVGLTESWRRGIRVVVQQ